MKQISNNTQENCNAVDKYQQQRRRILQEQSALLK